MLHGQHMADHHLAVWYGYQSRRSAFWQFGIPTRSRSNRQTIWFLYIDYVQQPRGLINTGVLHCHHCCIRCFNNHHVLFCNQISGILTWTISSWKIRGHLVPCRPTKTRSCAMCWALTGLPRNYKDRKLWSMQLTQVILQNILLLLEIRSKVFSWATWADRKRCLSQTAAYSWRHIYEAVILLGVAVHYRAFAGIYCIFPLRMARLS